MLKIVAISDVHNRWEQLSIPECDVLISCGDYSFYGEDWIVKNFHEWLNKQPAKNIISVQGNHETWVENNWAAAKKLALTACPRTHFVEHEAIEIEGVKFFASAWTPYFFNWAWNAHRGEEIKSYWDQIPLDTDVLVTHGPPYGILDFAPMGGHVGCSDLLNRIKEVHPAIHFFGHIHEGHGQHHEGLTSFYNVAICDGKYRPNNPMTVVEY